MLPRAILAAVTGTVGMILSSTTENVLAGLSRWLRQDLPRRVRRTFGLPIQHVLSGDTTPAAA